MRRNYSHSSIFVQMFRIMTVTWLLVLAGSSAFAQDEITHNEMARAGTQTGSARKRLTAEREAAARPFSILSHKPNYVLAGAYNFEGWDSSINQLNEGDPAYENQDIEVQFQA